MVKKKVKISKKVAKKAIKKPETAVKEADIQPWDILLYPHLAEKSMNMVEMENKMIFIVNPKADKNKIRQAVELGFNVKVLDVKTQNTQTGQKKAYIKLHPDHSAAEIASRLGML